MVENGRGVEPAARNRRALCLSCAWQKHPAILNVGSNYDAAVQKAAVTETASQATNEGH